MHAARQACRPKHQVLVLKCYPKFQKNNVEVRANSSELSYLLYYASTRRSKLMKVGDFLDKRTTADVWKGRIGNVQVTLEILKSLIEKCPRDLPLYAGAVLSILCTILKSNDITMVEESVPTFETLCAHQDPANLAADQDYIQRYEEVVQLYALFASKEGLKKLKTPPSWPVAIRYRKAGLQALKAVASSESLSSETGRQLAVIIPAVLWNIYPEDGNYLRRLEAREDEHEKEQALRRRQSISTVHTAEEGDFGDPIAAAGTTADADKLAEEEVGVIALQALKNIFIGVNRGQLRVATLEVIKFIAANVEAPQTEDLSECWPTTLMAMICSWAPVQDRYMILVSATESLVRSPIVESDMERQLVLATVIQYLLSSSINFIGLSVMDVLVGLISHILLLLQLGGPGSSITPHRQQTSSGLTEKENADPKPPQMDGVVMEIVKEPSPARIQLLDTLQRCMASLATHVYYSDQIADMVSALLSRLKPSPMSGISNSAEAIQDPHGAIQAVASSASLQDRGPHVDRFFSFETGRFIALQAVKAIIVTANTRRPDGSVASVSRSAVGVRVWEGTQWLLRDPSGKVRKAYVDALVTWLNMEMATDDLRLLDNRNPRKEKDSKGDLARRAVSNASHREKSPKPVRNTFLALLHLAVYESALHYTDSEPDFLLLHLLLSTLINKLGINAVRNGLPMIWRLQEDIHTIDDPGAKVMISSLVHGYLWALSMALEFETSSVGRILHTEISRRSELGLWLTNIRVPPMSIERIETPHPTPVRFPTEIVQNEALLPFDNRDALIEKIAEGYTKGLSSPPTSPPGSPSRSHSISLAHQPTLKMAPALPYRVQEELRADWTRDSCIAANTKDASAGSMTGSRTGTSHYKNNYLGVAIPNGGLESTNNSPITSPRRAHSHSRPPSTTYGLVGRVASPHRKRSSERTPTSTSSIHSAVRVDDLKRVLSGSAPRTSYSIRPHSRHRPFESSPPSSGSESLVSVHSLSEASFVTADPPHLQMNVTTPGGDTTEEPSSSSIQATPNSKSDPHSPSNAARERAASFGNRGVPPVPPIPFGLRDKSASPSGAPSGGPSGANQQYRPNSSGGDDRLSGANQNGNIAVRKSRSLKRGTGSSGTHLQGGSRSRSRGVAGGANGSVRKSSRIRKPDFSGFLDSIDAGDGDEDGDGNGDGGGLVGGVHGVGNAPY